VDATATWPTMGDGTSSIPVIRFFGTVQ
jgi:hypothetical protein